VIIIAHTPNSSHLPVFQPIKYLSSSPNLKTGLAPLSIPLSSICIDNNLNLLKHRVDWDMELTICIRATAAAQK